MKKSALFICVWEKKKEKQSVFLKNEKEYVKNCGK